MEPLEAFETLLLADLKKRVVEKIDEDVLAADIRLSLFMASLLSYKPDFLVRPFPLCFMTADMEKDFEGLEALCANIDSFKQNLRGDTTSSPKFWQLLDFVLSDKTFKIVTHGKNKFKEIEKLTGASSYSILPNYVFEVQYPDLAEAKFKGLAGEKPMLYAYHGSRVENFHSILHHGLHSHMNKTSLYGEGTYLSSDLSLSITYSPGGQGWKQSIMGERISCVAVCEMIDHPDIKCTLKDDSGNTRRSRAPESMGGSVPEKYYVVTNNQLIRLKYLLVYAEQKKVNRSELMMSPVIAWLRKHLFAAMMLAYIFILVLIGILNSPAYKAFLRSRSGGGGPTI